MARRPEQPLIPHRAAAQLSYEPRSEWLLGASRVELLQLEDPGRASVVHQDSGELEVVPLSALRPIRRTGSHDGPAAVEHTPEEWDRAAMEERVVRQYVESGKTQTGQIEACNSLGIAERTLREKVRKWINNPTPAGMMNKPNGRPSGSLGRDGHHDLQLQKEMVAILRLAPTISAMRLHEELTHTSKLGFAVPSLATIKRILKNLRRNLQNVSGQVGRELRYDNKSIEGAITSERPLLVIEMDSTVVDVHIKHPHLDVSIGRPWLTLAIDRCTRVILGIHLSLDPPSALSTALCLAHAVLPKDDWLKQLGLSDCILPGYGLPKTLYTDNGAEFKNGALDSVYHAYKIKHEFRPPGDPAKGGIVERAIGTFMGQIRLLPGASYSDILKRAPKDVDRQGTLTLKELLAFVVHAISRYHQTHHEGIFTSPLRRWQEAWIINGKPAAPRLPDGAENFVISLLPVRRVNVTRGTVTILRLQYRHSNLHHRFGPHIVRYDPRDVSRVYVQTKEGFVGCSLIDPGFPSMSFYEWKELRGRKRKQGPCNPEQLVKDVQAMRDIRERNAKRGVQKSARLHARQLEHQTQQPPCQTESVPFARPLGRIPKRIISYD